MTNDQHQISLDNSSKLTLLQKSSDRIIALIEGEDDAPGILAKLALHDEVLFGRKGSGMVNRVDLMWRIHVWLLCALSGAAGYLFKDLVIRMKL